MNCPHCSAEVEVAAEQCARCGGALPRRALSSRPPGTSGSGSERREASVVFCDLGGYTRWNEEEDPEEVALVMDAIRSEAARIFESHGGIVNQFVGDEVMGLFGIVSSHEDDPRRALAAALAFHAYLRSGEPFGNRRPWPLRLHSGAETGLIYVRVHDLRSGLFEVTGEAVNTAARMRAIAKPDELICGPAIKRQVEHFYRLEQRDPVRLYPTAQPIVPHRVVEPRTSNTWFEVAALRGLTHYVNRERELQSLLELWQQAETERGAMVAIVGQPGVGKTRLLHEFRARVGASATILQGRCSTYRNVAPYQPFIDALTGLLETFADAEKNASIQLTRLSDRYSLSGATRSSLAYLLIPGSDPSDCDPLLQPAELREAIVAALGEVIAAMARERPVLVILEDWHWADEASRNALRQIGSGLEHTRSLIAVNYRSTELTEQAQPRTTLKIELEPLDSSHTESMARDVLGGGQMPPGLSTFVHARTLGNPFFVEEICRSLLESGTCRIQSDSIVLLEPLFQLRAPRTVQAIVRARVDRLPDEQRALLRLASVIGPQFDLDLLEVLADDGPEAHPVPGRLRLLAMLRELERQDMLHRDAAGYRFKHAITREVVYESLPVRARRLQHARLAHEMEARTPVDALEPHYEALANHYRLGAERDKAIEFAVLAGDKAWRSFALEQAGIQYRHALEEMSESAQTCPEAKSRHIDVSLSWARVGIYNPHADQVAALRASLDFAAELRDQRRAALCLNWLSWIEYGLGDHEPSQQHAEQFLEESTSLGEARLVAQAHINLGRCYMVAANYAGAAEALERGLKMRVRANGAGHSFGLSNLAMVLGDRGDFALAHARIEESERIAQGQLSLLGPLLVLRAMVEIWQGKWEAALETSAQASDIAQLIEGRYILNMSALLGAFARFMTTRDVGALDQTREGIDQLESLGIRLHMSCNRSMLAFGHALARQYDSAQAAAEQALARMSAFDRQGEVEALRVLALVAALRDRQTSRAQSFVERAMTAARAKGSERDLALCDLSWSTVRHAHGDHAGAAALFKSAHSRAARIGMTLPRLDLSHDDRVGDER